MHEVVTRNQVWLFLLAIWANLPKYAPAICALVTGLASIAAGHRNEGLREILEAISFISGGTAVVAAQLGTNGKIHDVKLAVNSRLDELLETARLLAHAQGEKAGVLREQSREQSRDVDRVAREPK